MTIQTFKINAVSQLTSSPSPQLDVEILIEFFTGLSKTKQLLERQKELTKEEENKLFEALEKRKTGLPIAYITNKKEFFGYDFYVTPAVLIPKPDTEILVENAIDMILEKMEANPNRILTICDMCTGSGCIGLSVLKNLSENYEIPVERLPKFSLVDISPKALEIAQKNAELLLSPAEQERVRFIRSNLFEQVNQTFDFILTNPPYVPKKLTDKLLQDGRNEPRLALDGDVTAFGDASKSNDGLELIRRLTLQLKDHLSPLGRIIMETGEYNAEEASRLAQETGFKTELYRDLEGQLRGYVSKTA